PPRRAPPRGRPASLAAPPPGRSAAGAPPLPRRPGGGPDPPQRFRAQVAPRRETHPPKPPYPHWDPTAARRPWLRILAPVHQRVQQADDLLLPRGGRVKLVAHPSESAAHSASPSSTCDRRSGGYSRIALITRVFFSRDPLLCALVWVRRGRAASEDSGGCRVLLAAAHSLLQFAYPCLQRRDAAFHSSLWQRLPRMWRDSWSGRRGGLPSPGPPNAPPCRPFAPAAFCPWHSSAC